MLGCLAHFGPVLGLTSVPNNPTNALGRANKGANSTVFWHLLAATFRGQLLATVFRPSLGHLMATTFGGQLLATVFWPSLGHLVATTFGGQLLATVFRPSLGHLMATTFGGQLLATVFWHHLMSKHSVANRWPPFVGHP